MPWRVARQHQRRVPRVAAPQDAGSRPGTVLMCNSVQDWLMEQCDAHRCMHVRRPLAWGDVQRHVDLLARSPFLGRDQSVTETVKVALASSGQQFAADLSAKARRIVARVSSPGLPQNLSQQIQNDIEEVGTILVQMLPDAEELILKLEVFGENVCSRWHQDKYTCRAIITYNGAGTDYVEHKNVNLWELDNRGSNDHIILDKSQVLSADAADVLFMKGKLFPGTVKGLVHKSPKKRYFADGTIMNRLCLKLDVA